MPKDSSAGSMLIALAVASCSIPAMAGTGPAVSFVGIETVATARGWPAPVEKPDAVTLSGPRGSMEFGRDSRKVAFNDILVWLNVPTRSGGAKLEICRQDENEIVAPLLASDRIPGATPGRTVTLDPGHGGEDGGAVGPQGTIEKFLVLDIAKRVRTRLQASRITVHMTRSKDKTVSLFSRARLAGDWHSDLMVSIHMNYARDSAASGVETFVMASPGFESTSGGTIDFRAYPGNGHAPADALLGYCIQRGIVCYAVAGDRGVKRARFQVLKDAVCPAALVECGFLSNPHDETNLRSAAYRNKVAEGIASGILTYLSKVALTESAAVPAVAPAKAEDAAPSAPPGQAEPGPGTEPVSNTAPQRAIDRGPERNTVGN